MNQTTICIAAALALCGCSTTTGAKIQPADSTGAPGVASLAQLASTLAVQGEGVATARPDRAEVVVGAVAQAPTAAAAQQQVSATAQGIIGALRALGIPDTRVQTVDLSVTPVYARDQEPREAPQEPRIVAFRASNRLRVTLDDLAKIGPAVDAAIRAGANQLESLSFELADPGPGREALRLAIADARAKAEVMASALGVRLGEVVDVVETGAAPPVPLRAGLAEAARAPTPVQPGELESRARVTLRYRLEP